MTTLLDETTTDESADVDLHADGMPVYKKTSTPAPGEATAVKPPDTSVRPTTDWISGWCSSVRTPTGCTDGRETNKVGEPIVRCLYEAVNGDKAPHKILYCACTCHDQNRVAEDPNVGIKRELDALFKEALKAKPAAMKPKPEPVAAVPAD